MHKNEMKVISYTKVRYISLKSLWYLIPKIGKQFHPSKKDSRMVKVS